MRIVYIMLTLILCCNSLVFSKSMVENYKNTSNLFPNEILEDEIPIVKVDSLNEPAPGVMLLTTFNLKLQNDGYLMMIDKDAKPLFTKKIEKGVMDFKMAPNGLFSYSKAVMNGDIHEIAGFKVQNTKAINIITDETLKVIDSVQCANGFLSDPHEFRILPNGNYLLISYQDYPIDMSLITKGGNPNANVIATVIQELTADRKCVFQWRSLDHTPIPQSFANLLNASIAHTHGNSFYLDTDGNLLVSMASTFEIIKINMITGKVMWRFGGKKNEFTINGDNPAYKPFYFSMQHDIKRLPNGNILFYDNGFARMPRFSRAVEYSIDENNKIANLVWEYRHNPDIAAFAMGSAQRLSNGNTLINWGMLLSSFKRMATEVTPDKQIAAEYSLPSDLFSYRVLKYELPSCMPIADVIAAEGAEGNTYEFKDEISNTGVTLFIKNIDAFVYNYLTMKKYDCSPLNPAFEAEAPVLLPNRWMFTTTYINSIKGEFRFDVNELAKRYNYSDLKVYYRPKEAEGVFKMLPTEFVASENQLVASISDSGEYVIGFPRVAAAPNKPVLIYPFNNKLLVNDVPVYLEWTPTGRYDEFNLQIAENSDFSTLVFDTVSNNTSNKKLLAPNKEYFWRVKTKYAGLESDWSQTYNFKLGSPQISMINPKDKDTIYFDSTIVNRWKTNVDASVNLSLYKGNTFVLSIKDSLFSKTGAFAWKIPNTLEEGNDYKIVIYTNQDKVLISQASDLTIMKHPVGINDKQIESKLKISPNPNNGSFNISFNLENSGNCKTEITDLLGNKIYSFDNGFLSAGEYNYKLNLSSLAEGIYLCTIKSNTDSYTVKIVVSK